MSTLIFTGKLPISYVCVDFNYFFLFIYSRKKIIFASQDENFEKRMIYKQSLLNVRR